MKKEDDFNNLYKKVDATSKTRFHASRRLKRHSKYSTISIVCISLGLILISLMSAYGLGANIESDLVNLIQVFFAIAVLVYSLLIDKNDYSKLSEKMYSCASKLGELKQNIYPLLESNDSELYNRSVCEYHEILRLYETHSNNDFRGDNILARLEMPENYPMSFRHRLVLRARVWIAQLLDFSPYFFVGIALTYISYWLWFGSAATSI